MTPVETAGAELHWLLTAPPLLRVPTGVEDGGALLATLIDDPPSLQRASTHLAGLPRPRRLGHHFENLVACALSHHRRFKVLARNLSLRQGTDTLGELDLLVRDHADGTLCHWELALKFYLGLPGETSQRGWPGPDLRDQLEHKVAHLFDKQLPRSSEPAVRRLLAEQGWTVQRRVLLTRGRLFYPWQGTPPVCKWVHLDHQRGIWRPFGQTEEIHVVPHHLWHVPELSDKPAPVTPHGDDNPGSRPDLQQQRPIMVADRHQQVSFLVPPAWPHQRQP